jgi:hypothetical protein
MQYVHAAHLFDNVVLPPRRKRIAYRGVNVIAF